MTPSVELREWRARQPARLALTSCSAFQLEENSCGLRGSAATAAAFGPFCAAVPACCPGPRRALLLRPFPPAAASGSAFAMRDRGEGAVMRGERCSARRGTAPRSLRSAAGPGLRWRPLVANRGANPEAGGAGARSFHVRVCAGRSSAAGCAACGTSPWVTARPRGSGWAEVWRAGAHGSTSQSPFPAQIAGCLFGCCSWPEAALVAALFGCNEVANVVQKLSPSSCSCKSSRSSSIPPRLSPSAVDHLSCLFKLSILCFRSTWCLRPNILITLGPEIALRCCLQSLQHDHQSDHPSAHNAPSGALLALHPPRGKPDLQKALFPGSLFLFLGKRRENTTCSKPRCIRPH